MNEFDYRSDKDLNSRAVLVGVVTGDRDENEVNKSLSELERLADTAGAETVARLTQNKSSYDPRTLIGSGKVRELSELCKNNGVDLVIFDEELTPSQIRNLEDDIGKDDKGDSVRVIDRSMLILDIFALHAVSGEGKLQVELAQLKYTAPRLTGRGKDLSRLGGGIGTRGPGESKLESDKRHIKRRIDALEEELKLLDKNRRTMRASRDKSGVPKIAIVGYTNAGKSTLLNRLTDAGILAEDKLFATLDPTTRKFILPCGEDILLTDTVGFIRKLPHHLVKAFKSTLDEAVYADIIMIVADASDSECVPQLEVTENLLSELGASGKPTVYVFNKCDRGVTDEASAVARRNNEGENRSVAISALNGSGCDDLISILEDIIHKGKKRVHYLFPNSEQKYLNRLYELATVEDVVYGYEGVEVTAVVDQRTKGLMERFEV